MTECSGIFGRSYEIYVPSRRVHETEFPNIRATIERVTGATSVTCRHHEASMEEEGLDRTVVGICSETVAKEDPLLQNGVELAAQALFALFRGRNLNIKFTNPGETRQCTLLAS